MHHRRCPSGTIGSLVADMPHASAKIAPLKQRHVAPQKRTPSESNLGRCLYGDVRCKRDVMAYDADSISNAERAGLRGLRDLVKGRVTHESAVPRLNDCRSLVR
jgi:hypothetical protein